MQQLDPHARTAGAPPARLGAGPNGESRLDPLFREFLDQAAAPAAGDPPPLRAWVELAEAWRIARALRDCRGNRSAAARALGIGRRTLYTKMEKLGLAERWDAPVLESTRR